MNQANGPRRQTVYKVVMGPVGTALNTPVPRSAKPRGSLADAVKARRECVPCRQAEAKEAKDLAPPVDPDAYISTARLVADTRTLSDHVDPETDVIIGVSRSGLLPASLVAYHTHRPLLIVSRQSGILNPGHGGRMEGRENRAYRKAILIDDTAVTGSEMRACAAIVARDMPGVAVTRAVIYAHPGYPDTADVCVSKYGGPHYLEWNWVNSGHAMSCAFDMDGIICRDFTAEECATPERYREAMAAITPRFLPRRKPVPLIVTARPESTRAITETWLARQGVAVGGLVMRTFEVGPGEDWQRAIAGYKATHYRACAEPLFVESEPEQARIIADLAGKPVLCPEAGRLFRPGGGRG